MNPDAIYGKTAKGSEEITQRTHKLPARLRALLIMIDGKTPINHLIARSPSPDEAAINVATLLREGFIEAKEVGASRAATPGSAPVAVDPAEKAKRFMIKALVEALGPDADHFTGKVEAARSLAALAELAPKYIEVVRAGGGGRKAAAFRAGLVEYGVLREGG